MGNLLKVALGAVGLAGGGIPTGYLIIGAVAAILAILGGTWTAGYNYRGTLDASEALKIENARLQSAAEETSRQLDSVNRIQQRDTDRAAMLAKRNAELEANVEIACEPSAPPVSSGVRVPVPRVRPGAAEYPARPGRRGNVRSGPIVAPLAIERGRSE